MLRKHETNILLGKDNCNAYDDKRLDSIPTCEIQTRSFSSRESRKAFLAGLALGLENTHARLLTLNDVAMIEDMNDLKELQAELASTAGNI